MTICSILGNFVIWETTETPFTRAEAKSPTTVPGTPPRPRLRLRPGRVGTTPRHGARAGPPATSPNPGATSRRRSGYPASALPISPDAPRTSTFPVTTAVMSAERYSRSRSMAVSTFPISPSSFAVSRSK